MCLVIDLNRLMTVKLFIGNLSEGTSSNKLKGLFLQRRIHVQECDVIKNYAFVVDKF